MNHPPGGPGNKSQFAGKASPGAPRFGAWQMARLFCLLLIGLLQSEVPAQSGKTFHLQAHSHNDYLQKRPLLDALDNGFCGVEADIYLVNGELLVAHDLEKTVPGETLEKLYLNPLQERVRKNKGRVYPNGPSLLLLIDIKTNAPAVYPVLMKELSKYKSILTTSAGDKVQTNAVTVVLSGDRPRELLRKEQTRLAFYDGRFEDVGTGEKRTFMPLISDNWKKYLSWKGDGPITAADRDALSLLVRKVHAEGKQIRFWGAPDNPEAWAVLCEAGVDWINTDHLKPLARFLSDRAK